MVKKRKAKKKGQAGVVLVVSSLLLLAMIAMILRSDNASEPNSVAPLSYFDGTLIEGELIGAAEGKVLADTDCKIVENLIEPMRARLHP